MILISHPTGNNNVREAAISLADSRLLSEFHLGIAACDGNFFAQAARLPGLSEIRRRSYDSKLASFLKLHPWRETGRLTASRMGWNFLTSQESSFFGIDSVYRSFDRAVARRVEALESKLTAVYCYEDGALETFRVAKRLGLKCIYDLPIAYWRRSRTLLEEQAECYPSWEPTLVGTRDSSSKCARKDSELELADAILCPSGFVRDSLPEGTADEKLVSVTPFGSPRLAQTIRGAEAGFGGRDTPLKVLFVGSMTQRKGLADLFEAMKLLDPTRFELHVLGSPIAPMDFYTDQYGLFIHHATRPHDQVLKLMRSMDVFVLPSIVEGRALVQQEALACGLPIVVTANAGAEDLVENEKAGFLIPINDPRAIAQRLEQLEQDRHLLAEMSLAAVEKAGELTWASYRTQVVDAVKECLQSDACVART